MGKGCLLDNVGLWADFRVKVDRDVRPILFLDRDGVLIRDADYVGCAARTKIFEDVADAVRSANETGVALVIVTNQSGVGRGYFGWDGFAEVQYEIDQTLAAGGAYIDAVLACAYHRDAIGCFAIADHSWRKPNPGMIQYALHVLNGDPSRSGIIGDKLSDLQAGAAAGLSYGYLIGDSFLQERTLSIQSHEASSSLLPQHVQSCSTFNAGVTSFLKKIGALEV